MNYLQYTKISWGKHQQQVSSVTVCVHI